MIRILHKGYFLLVMLLLSIISFAQTTVTVKEQQMKVLMRMIGHEFLMQMGDSTTRILPITFDGGRYKIQFDNEFAIEPDLVSFAANKVFKEQASREPIFQNDFFRNGFANNAYIMEVLQCETQEVVYGFIYNPVNDEGVIPCKSRSLPKDCYQFYFTLEDTTLYQAQTVSQTKASKRGNAFFYGLFLLVPVLAITVYYFKRKRVKSAAQKEIMAIGQYQFDKKAMKLRFDGKVEDLSSKEADLLELLATNKNKILAREHILNIVWNDEGDYVGRTLDVSISKLRKKLKADTSLKIVNIRGVGYRFTVEN